MIDAALEAGVTFLDTADIYGSGDSERFIGAALGERRNEVVLGRSSGRMCRSRPRRLPRPPAPCDRRVARAARDGRDRPLHVSPPRRLTPLEETLAAMNELVDEGRVRWLGLSNATQATSAPRPRAASPSSPSRPAAPPRRRRRGGAASCRELGIGYVPYFPLASGLLTGKHPARRGRARRLPAVRQPARRAGLRRRRGTGGGRRRARSHACSGSSRPRSPRQSPGSEASPPTASSSSARPRSPATSLQCLDGVEVPLVEAGCRTARSRRARPRRGGTCRSGARWRAGSTGRKPIPSSRQSGSTSASSARWRRLYRFWTETTGDAALGRGAEVACVDVGAGRAQRTPPLVDELVHRRECLLERGDAVGAVVRVEVDHVPSPSRPSDASTRTAQVVAGAAGARGPTLIPCPNFVPEHDLVASLARARPR